jgi:hypothetical protein
MNANKFNSDTLKNAITRKIKKIIMAKTSQTHLAHELLKVENVQREKTTPMARIINCIKLTENHIIEKAIQEKNHFLMCCGNIIFINIIFRNKNSYAYYTHIKKIRKFFIRILYSFWNFCSFCG